MFGYAAGVAITIALLRWSWLRFDGLGVLVAVLSPFIGLFCGGLLILLFAWGVMAVGYVCSADFRRQWHEFRAEQKSVTDEDSNENSPERT